MREDYRYNYRITQFIKSNSLPLIADSENLINAKTAALSYFFLISYNSRNVFLFASSIISLVIDYLRSAHPEFDGKAAEPGYAIADTLTDT